VRTLLALDLPLGPQLENAIRDCVEHGDAFCVLDQRVALQRREDSLVSLGATAVLDTSGRQSRPEGRMVDNEVGLVMLTSGSSGAPKAAELSWDALKASAELTQATLRNDAAPIWFPCLPANHIGGLAVILRAIFSDASLLWASNDEIEQAPERGATHASLVRAQLARYDVSGYYRVLLGGARPPHDLPDNVVTTWGMTETGSGVFYNGYALPGVDILAIDGELCVRTPTLFRRYRNAERARVKGPDGRHDWFPTGDAGEVVDGKVKVFGRLGYVINTGGEKVWPEDLEAVLIGVPGVRDVAVVGIDDHEWGQRVVAIVVGDHSALNEVINDTAEERIGPWAKPKTIRYVSAIPRTSGGKIRRADLAALL
jgi:O-succinylbenzoic acid--CoA ligase